MAASEERFRVPAALRARVREIVELTDAMCASRLDSEYAELCRRLVAKLARKRPSPIERGETRVWAAGAIYAIGQNNFLFDATQTPHLAADQLSELVGVPKSTMAAKAKRIRDAVRAGRADGPGVLPRRTACRPPARVARRGQRSHR